MAATHDADHDEDQSWEERTLNLLPDSKIDQEFSAVKARKYGQKRHKIKWMKRPMALSETVLEILDEELRENAIRYLSNFLIEKREEDPDNYYRAGFMLFNACSTMSVLLQEVVVFFGKMANETPDVRSIKRLANVLTLFQSVAANKETRHKFVDACIPNFLIPLILFKSTIELFDMIRAIALSVIGILCQGREPRIILWAVNSNMIEVCCAVVEDGSELNKVIAMHILEAILKDKFGISYICEPQSDSLLNGLLMRTWNKQVDLLSVDQDPSPRLLFHIIRCYIIICTSERGYNAVLKRLPSHILSKNFRPMIVEFPIIKNLLYQLITILKM